MKNRLLVIIILALILIIGTISLYFYIYTNQPPKGDICQDLCGDGICQEVVCLAEGCPCPETQENCPQDCKLGASYLNSKSCKELEELSSKEFDKLNFTCEIDTDCAYTDVLLCGGCVNKHTNTKLYGEIQNVLRAKDCPFPLASCILITGCKCLNNKCEPTIKKTEKEETFTWKTYKSENYSFEVKYPNDWYYHISNFNEVNRQMICFNPRDISEDECIIVLIIDEDNSLSQMYTNTKQMLKETNTITESVTTINNIQAKVITTNATVGLSRTLFFERDGNVYNFSMEVGQETVFEKMFSTFKF